MQQMPTGPKPRPQERVPAPARPARIPVRAAALAAVAGLCATAALAHEGAAAHHHPHGSEFVWAGLLGAAALGGYVLARLRERRK